MAALEKLTIAGVPVDIYGSSVLVNGQPIQTNDTKQAVQSLQFFADAVRHQHEKEARRMARVVLIKKLGLHGGLGFWTVQLLTNER